MVGSNPPTAGTELVEETIENFAEDYIEDVVEDVDAAEEITEYNNIDLTVTTDYGCYVWRVTHSQVSSDCVLLAPLTHLYDKYKAYSQKELLEKAKQLFYQISITDDRGGGR